MKYNRLKSSAEQIKMPDSLRESILEKCDDVSAAANNSATASNEHVFTVERVNSHPVRRTFAAVAACAVIVGGVGYTAHLAVRRSGVDSATDMSETQVNPILEAFDGLLSREFKIIQKDELINESIAADMYDPSTIESDRSIIPSEEQRKAIIDIISEYQWTEITEEEYTANGVPEALCLLDAFEHTQIVDYQYAGSFWDLVINADGLAEFCYTEYEYDTSGEEQLETVTDTSGTFYRVENSEELAERILNVFAPETETEEVTEAPAEPETDFSALTDFENIEYMEMGYNSSTPLSQEQRSAIAELFRGLDFEPYPTYKAYQLPAYSFSADDKLIFFYYYGTVEVRSGDNTQFFETDFEAVDSGLNSILYDGKVITGADLLCDNFLNENVYIFAQKSYEHLSLSPRSIAIAADVLAKITFRPAEHDDIQSFITTSKSDWYDRKMGFESLDLGSSLADDKAWAMNIYDGGKVEIVEAFNVSDKENCKTVCHYYIANTTELYTTLCGAIPELVSTASAPFGYIYMRGDVTINGELLTDETTKAVSNLFIGFKYENEQTADTFPEQGLVYTIEADNLTVKVYEDGTVAYSHATDKAGDTDGLVHIYPRLGCPETIRGNYIQFTIEYFLDSQHMD